MGIKRRIPYSKLLFCFVAFSVSVLYIQTIVDKKYNDLCNEKHTMHIKEPPAVIYYAVNCSNKLPITEPHDSNETDHEVKLAEDLHSHKKMQKTSKTIQTTKHRPKVYTFAEFKQKAQTDNFFLSKILTQSYLHSKSYHVLRRYFTGKSYSFESEFKNVSIQHNYDINTDVMVFLHIQKTGGMHFNDRLIRELSYPFKCKCVFKQPTCPCFNPKGNIWIYTSKLSGWPCGLHADWTQLHRCIPNQIDQMEQKRRYRRYFYFTQLRDPIARYMSEYYHQSFYGGHWQDALLGCSNGMAEWLDVRPCFLSETWQGVGIDEFIDCKYNLATNRMTRMLADLTVADCYVDYINRNVMRKRAYLWLESAKHNLQQMEYFGIMENREWSDALFSSVFQMGFKKVRKSDVRSKSADIRLTEDQFLKLLKLVELDIHLYLFATDLFQTRIRNLHI